MKIKSYIFPFILSLFSYPCVSQPSNEYKLIWYDEFNGTELDTTKWNYRGLGPRRDAINVKNTVSLDGKGNLVLTTKKVGNEYHTAMIGTQGKFEAKFGYFECRVQMQKEIGHWSAFWLQSPTIQRTGDPKLNGTEIDIYEYHNREFDTVQINIHWDGYGDSHKHQGTKYYCENFSKGFHTIALEWTPEEYIFYVDNNEAWRTEQAVSHVKQYIILSLEVGKWGGDIKKANLPDSLIVDYVRVYQKK